MSSSSGNDKEELLGLQGYLLDHLEHPHDLALCNPEAMCREAGSDAVQLALLRGLARFELFLGAFLILSGIAHHVMVVVMVML
jgi:hypothetical protein